MSMTDIAHYPVVEWAIGKLSGALAKHRRRALLHELDALGYEASVIARDLGITRSQLRALAVQEPGFPGELKQMLGALKLDPELRKIDVTLSRDMQSLCAICASKRRCHRELRAGTAAENYGEFCPNAGNLDELRAEDAPRSKLNEFCPNPNLMI
jgi:hypothetical protein